MSRVAILTVVGFVVSSQLWAQHGVRFDPGCTLPFDDIKVHRSIDDRCGIAGNASDAAGQAQNRAKNYFCATGAATNLTLRDFAKLQKAADDAGIWRKPDGKPSPTWRAKLVDIWNGLGEGDLVSFVGFIDEVYAAVPKTGESVNCNQKGEENNDIHIELGEKLNPSSCKRLITEISPHYRPDGWTTERLKYVSLAKRPVRVSGSLFWDASHSPCGRGEPEQWRATTWEIHPIYQVEVCSSGSITDCRNGSASQWTPLHEWTAAPWDWDTTDGSPVQPDPGR